MRSLAASLLGKVSLWTMIRKAGPNTKRTPRSQSQAVAQWGLELTSRALFTAPLLAPPLLHLHQILELLYSLIMHLGVLAGYLEILLKHSVVPGTGRSWCRKTSSKACSGSSFQIPSGFLSTCCMSQAGLSTAGPTGNLIPSAVQWLYCSCDSWVHSASSQNGGCRETGHEHPHPSPHGPRAGSVNYLPAYSLALTGAVGNIHYGANTGGWAVFWVLKSIPF